MAKTEEDVWEKIFSTTLVICRYVSLACYDDNLSLNRDYFISGISWRSGNKVASADILIDY